MKPLLVLFLSTGNAARSLIAEALLNAKGSDRFTARSAGYKPLPEVHPETVALLRAEGLATENLHTKGWGEFLASAHILKADVIVTLSEEARQNCPAWPGDPVKVHWTVDDPLGAERPDVREWKFRKCFATLEARVNTLVRSRLPQTPGELFLQLKDIGMVV
ncbi:MAG: arsenate reductase ArsC [Alphaproteobacteria bacterium]|nr:arsenate reductase ArsC [Alphaproteobacteria bacterium]